MRIHIKQAIRNRGNLLLFYALVMLPAFILISGFMGCENKKPIKVGFVGCLTGRLSSLGTSGRDGVILAVENLNNEGGINGHPVELIVKDDKQDPEVAVQVDKELIKQGVVAIIGHMTSAMSVAALPLINKEKTLMISPTTSTHKLAGIDDYFIRVMSLTRAQADHIANHAFKGMGLRKIAVVYDLSNRTFAEGLYHIFKSEFENMGGAFTLITTFTSGKDVSYLGLSRKMLESEPDGLLIIAGALDTAMTCQQIRKLGSDIPVIISGWANTLDLIEHGGPAVEGVIFSAADNKDSERKDYLTFKRQFNERFGRNPYFGAVFGYEAAQLLFSALSKTDDVKKLKDTIINQAIYHGLQGDIRMDKYGDVKRKRFLVTVKDGQFETQE